MKVLVNNKEKIIPVGCTIDRLAQIIGIKPDDSIALAIDEDILQREEWKERKLTGGEKITIIGATCGG